MRNRKIFAAPHSTQTQCAHETCAIMASGWDFSDVTIDEEVIRDAKQRHDKKEKGWANDLKKQVETVRAQ